MLEMLVLLGSYLFGSVSFGYLIAKYWGGIDIRQYGSGNVGTTNVFRIVGPIPGIMAFIGDFLKGYLSTFLALQVGGEMLAVFAGLAAIVGHSYSIFLGFKGGKIIATGVGVIVAMNYVVGTMAIGFFLIILSIFKYVSLASILAASTVPLAMVLYKEPLPFIIFSFLGVTFAIYRHIPNIKRLMAGTEHKIGQKKKK